MPLLKENTGFEREALFWHFPAYLEGKAEGARDKYFRTRPCGAVRKGDWKLIEFYHEEKAELYNLKDDIGEQNELSKKNPEKKAELLKMLHDWQKKIGAKMPTPNPNYDPNAAKKPKKKQKKK